MNLKLGEFTMIGKHFILTGGTSGLGKAILKTLLTKKED